MSWQQFHNKQRKGTAAIELLLTLASFVVASFVFLKLGMMVSSVFFGDGNQLAGLPLF